jgi:hypothetical protein
MQPTTTRFCSAVSATASRRMTPRITRAHSPPAAAVAIREDCVRYWEAYLSGDRRSTQMRRCLQRRILRYMKAGNESAAAWILLADLHMTNPSTIRCLRRALHLSPRNPEAHAELAARLSAQGARQRTVRLHCQAALRRCRTSDVQDVLLYTIYNAATCAGLHDIAHRAWTLGRRRFPRSPLFRKP